MPQKDHELASVALSKDEAPIYRLIIRKYGITDEYLSGRRLEFPPEHYVELSAAFADFGAREIADSYEGEKSFLEVVDLMADMMRKLADGLGEAGLADEAREQMIEEGIGENPYV